MLYDIVLIFEVVFFSNHYTATTCNFFGIVSAKPLPAVTWFRNDMVVSNASVALPSAGTTHVRSELRISGLGRRDVHSELTCQATNNPKTQPLAATLHVDMNCKWGHRLARKNW